MYGPVFALLAIIMGRMMGGNRESIAHFFRPASQKGHKWVTDRPCPLFFQREAAAAKLNNFETKRLVTRSCPKFEQLAHDSPVF